MNKDILHKVIEKWGPQIQINKIQEEVLELALALNQLNCPTKDKDKLEAAIYDELADVKIMMAQADILFDKARIDERIKFKLERLQRRYFS